MKTPSGLENKTVILHATTTTKVRNRPPQKTITHPHATPKMAQKNTELLGGGEGVITLPLPSGKPKKVAVEEPLLFSHRKMYHSAKKRNKQL